MLQGVPPSVAAPRACRKALQIGRYGRARCTKWLTRPTRGADGLRYSNNTYFYIPLHKLYYYLTLIIHILNIVFILYINNKYQITNQYILILPLIIALLISNIIYTKPIVNDDSYNVPPSFIKKNTIIFIVLLILLTSLLVINIIPIFKDNDWLNNYLLCVLPINIILISIITYKYITYSPCKYNLPISWYF